MAEANVVVRVEHRELGDAIKEAEKLASTLQGLRDQRVTLLTNAEKTLSDLSRVNQEIVKVKNSLDTLRNSNVTGAFDQDIAKTEDKLKGLNKTLDDLTKQRKINNLDLSANSKAIEKATIEYREAQKAADDYARAVEAAAKADAKALANRQAASLKAEQSFAASRQKEIEAARAMAIDAGRSTPQTFEEYTAARERQKAAADAAAKAEQEATKAMHDAVQQRINDERRDNAQIRAAAAERQKIADETAKKEAEAIKTAAEEAHKARMDMYAEQYRLQDLERRQDEFNQSQKREEEVEQLERQAEAAEHLRSVLQGVSSVMNAGASVSNFLGDFSQGIGSSFSGMASLFGNNQVSTALTRFVTYNALRGITGNLSNTIERYDIMSTFLPYMAVAGVGEEQAQLALDRVNQAILGLPIGLDESAQRLRRYQMFLGDIDSATNLTIGAQNAILAGGASPQMQTHAYYQIDRLLSAGRLSTSRQWLSLIQGMGVSMRFVSEAMGTTGMNAKELAAGLTSGAISTEAFLDALMELGKGESDAAQGLEATLEIYKGTIEAWINNIQFAATRGGENVMKALNQTLVDATGQGITGYMKNYRDFLNGIFGKADEGGGISGWIKDNQDAIVNVMGKGYDLIEALSRFNASDIGLGIVGNTERLFSAISTGLNSIPDGKLEEFVSFATTLAGPVGAGMTQASNLGMMLGVFERFKDFDFDMLTSDISDAVGDMSNIVNGLLNFGPLGNDSIMSNLLAYGAVFGKPVGSFLSTMARGVSSLAMLKLAFPGLFKTGAKSGGMGFLASAFEGGLPASVEGELAANALWGEAVPSAGTALGLLVPSLLAGGIFAGLSAANARNYSQLMGGYTYSNLTPDQTNISDVLSHARAIFNQSTQIPAFNREQADKQRSTGEYTMSELYDEYNQQLELLQTLQKERDFFDSEIKRINAGLNGEGVITAEDVKNLSSYEQGLKNVDGEIKSTSSRMLDLNDEIVRQGTYLGSLTIKYGDYEIVLEETGNLYEGSEQKVSAYTERIRNLAAAFSEVAKNAAEAAKESLSGFSGIELPDTPKGGYTKQNIEGMESQITAGEQVLKSASTIKQYIDDLEASGFNKNGENFIGYLQEILNLEDFGEKTKQLNELADLLSTGGDLQTALDTFGKREDLKSQVDAIFQDLGTSVSTFATDSEKARTSLEKMVESAKELSSSDINIGAFKESLMGFGDEGMQTAATNLSDAATHIATLKEQLMGFAEETPEPVDQATSDVSTDMGDMATSVDGSSQTTVTAVQNIDSAFASSTAPADAANVSNGIASGLEQGLSRIQNASTTIQNQISMLNGLSATVTINTVTNTVSGVRADGSDITPTSVGAATGGPVFKAFGSDTVPYMLTPGEYIIRKGAADFFGRGLLERINALDIGGAFDRLILNSPVTAGRFGGNVYNKDNHASVVQNYYNSSPDYGNRRAWRFAHSL